MPFPAFQIRMPPEMRRTLDERLEDSAYGSLNKYLLACIETGSAILQVLPPELVEQFANEPDAEKKFKLIRAFFDLKEILPSTKIVVVPRK